MWNLHFGMEFVLTETKMQLKTIKNGQEWWWWWTSGGGLA